MHLKMKSCGKKMKRIKKMYKKIFVQFQNMQIERFFLVLSQDSQIDEQRMQGHMLEIQQHHTFHVFPTANIHTKIITHT